MYHHTIWYCFSVSVLSVCVSTLLLNQNFLEHDACSMETTTKKRKNLKSNCFFLMFRKSATLRNMLHQEKSLATKNAVPAASAPISVMRTAPASGG